MPTVTTRTRDLKRRARAALTCLVLGLLSVFSSSAAAQPSPGFIAEVLPEFGSEPSDLICFDLFRLGDPNLELIVLIGLSEVFGTSQAATLGEDYELVNAQAVFERGMTELQVCPVQVLDDTLREGTESLALTFIAVDSISRQQTIRRSQTVIQDDDLVGPDLGVSLRIQSGDRDVEVVVENFGTEILTGIELTLEGQFVSDPRASRCSGMAGPTGPFDGGPEVTIVCRLATPLAPKETWKVPVVLQPYYYLSADIYAVSARVTDDGARGADEDPSNNSVQVELPAVPGGCLGDLVELHCSCFVSLMYRAVGRSVVGILGFSSSGHLSGSRSPSSTWISRAKTTVGHFMRSANGLLTLYRVRDRMTKTPGGQRGVDLYYRHTAEIRDLLLGSPSLMAETLFVADEWADHLTAFSKGLDNDTVITASQMDVLEALLDRLESVGSPALVVASRSERDRMELASLVGESLAVAFAQLDRLSCVPGANTMCLDDGRFSVNVSWSDFQGNRGLGRAVQVTRDTGAFWFFDDQNLELLVKVLDGTAVNGAHWVFYGALSDVGYEIGVTDTQTGEVRLYKNESGEFGSGGDIGAFPMSSRMDPIALDRATPVDVVLLKPRRRSLLPAGACVDGATTLCLSEGRFEVTVHWEDFQGGTGVGNAVPLTRDTGSFWFFDEDNLELMIKVLDATAINDHYWVFYGALSNVGYSISVRDTSTGQVATYFNAKGEFGSAGDIEALDGDLGVP